MKSNVRLRLIGILESVKGIETTIAGKDFAATIGKHGRSSGPLNAVLKSFQIKPACP